MPSTAKAGNLSLRTSCPAEFGPGFKVQMLLCTLAPYYPELSWTSWTSCQALASVGCLSWLPTFLLYPATATPYTSTAYINRHRQYVLRAGARARARAARRGWTFLASSAQWGAQYTVHSDRTGQAGSSGLVDLTIAFQWLYAHAASRSVMRVFLQW